MNKENAKDYLPLVQALAEGKTIEFLKEGKTIESLNLNAQWEDCICPSFNQMPVYYRIKKEEPKSWYRVCLTTQGAMAASSEKQEEVISNFPIFVRWLTGRIEYELPEGDA